MKTQNRILFTTIYDPEPLLDRWAATDQMGYRLTRAQGIFTLYEHAHSWPIHLLAQNIQRPSVVLEWPSLEEFERECAGEEFEFVCITFMNRDLNKLAQMTAIIRKRCPKAKIVVGGYGVICLHDDKQAEIEPEYDYICRGEGVFFMRELLGEDTGRPVSCYLPQSGALLPWLVKRGRGTVGALLSGLGCTQRCPFCVTSFYAKGNFLQVLSDRGIYEGMLRYWKTNPLTSTVNIYDENFLERKDRADAIGKMIRNDTTYGLRHLNYFTFSTIKAISAYEPDELLLNGVDSLWVGVESSFARLGKLHGLDCDDLFAMLHSIGIKTVGSFIMGMSVQNPDNIEIDEDMFVDLNPTFQQISVLIMEPNTPLYQVALKRGEITKKYPWENYHLYGQTYEPKEFTFEELLERVDNLYKRLYQTNGPSLMRMLECNLNGFRYCMSSKNRLLREQKSDFFKRRVRNYAPMLGACIEFAPTDLVRTKLRNLEREIVDTFGPFTESQTMFREHILKLAEAEHEIRGDGDRPITKDDFRRYTYDPGRTSAGKPYLVSRPGLDLPPEAGSPRISKKRKFAPVA